MQGDAGVQGVEDSLVGQAAVSGSGYRSEHDHYRSPADTFLLSQFALLPHNILE